MKINTAITRYAKTLGRAGGLGIAITSCLAVTHVEAAPVAVTFDFTSVLADAPFYTYTDAATGLILTVTPWTFTLGPTVLTAGHEVTQVGSGLGVEGTASESQPHIEAKQGLNELAQFSFSNNVILTSISFANVDNGGNDDTVRFFFDGPVADGDLDDFGSSTLIKDPPDNSLDLITTYTLANVTGKLFGFGAYLPACTETNEKKCDNIEWRIQSISLTYDKNQLPPGEVPLPAALPLLAAGLGGMAWLSRRQKRGSN